MHRKTSIYFLFCFRELYFSITLPMDSEQFRTEVEILDYILSCLQSLNVCFFLWEEEEVSDTLDVHKYISHSYNEIILLVCFTCKCLRASRPWNEVMNLFINEQMKVMKLFWRFFSPFEQLRRWTILFCGWLYKRGSAGSHVRQLNVCRIICLLFRVKRLKSSSSYNT